MVILFLGPSGSGKDTQAELLSKNKNYLNISTGDLYRDLSNGATKIQSYIRKMLNDGFANDYLTYGILQTYLKYVGGENFILNGAVRNYSQVEFLDTTLNSINRNLNLVFNFLISDDILINRLNERTYCKVCKANYNNKTNAPQFSGFCDNCKSALFRRDDDNPESIKKRLEAFRKNNSQILDEYQKRGIVIDVDATKSIDEIYKFISGAIDIA